LVDRSTDDPKYRPVYEAILRRPGMSRQPRQDAAQALVVLNQSDMPTELLAAIDRLNLEDGSESLVFEELASLLLGLPHAELARQESMFLEAADSASAASRRAAYAALAVAGSPNLARSEAEQRGSGRLELLSAIVLIPQASLRDSLRDFAIESLGDKYDLAVHRAALEALQVIPAAPTDTFRTTTAFLDSPDLRAAAVRTLLTIPKEQWPKEQAGPLLDRLVTSAEATPAALRTEDEFLSRMQLADQLLTLLPKGEASRYRKALESIAVRVVQINTVREEMRYDTRYFAVKAGRPVQVVLRNDDLMPHNLVIVAPGTLGEVALAAEAMPPDPDSQGRQYVPTTQDVLFATRMVQAGRHEGLTFTAPDEPGEYPFVCTFPRHWMRMYGVMVVVRDLDAWLAQPQEPADPLGSRRAFVQSWKVEDFDDDLASAPSGRHFDAGQRLFYEATCAGCHKMRGEGGFVGPELSDVFERWKGDRRGIAREILDPSQKVDAQYAVRVILTLDGQVLSGVVKEEGPQAITIVTDPESPAPQKVARSDIDEVTTTSTSMMPRGLLDRFTRDEVRELLAYLESGGSPDHAVYQNAEAK
jgi:putative heme-binding domain-containing protein